MELPTIHDQQTWHAFFGLSGRLTGGSDSMNRHLLGRKIPGSEG
jgi:hypothetical protein